MDLEATVNELVTRAMSRTELGRTLAAIRRLSGKDREALLLAAAGELGLGDTARVLGISLSALKMRIHRARSGCSSFWRYRDMAWNDDSHDSRNELDERLRAALAPPPEAVARIVRNALAESGAETSRPRIRIAAPLAAALLVAVAFLFAWRLEQARARPAIASVGDVVVATSPDGDWIVRSEEPETDRPQGLIIISYGGGE